MDTPDSIPKTSSAGCRKEWAGKRWRLEEPVEGVVIGAMEEDPISKEQLESSESKATTLKPNIFIGEPVY